ILPVKVADGDLLKVKEVEEVAEVVEGFLLQVIIITRQMEEAALASRASKEARRQPTAAATAVARLTAGNAYCLC
ncbi:hypothetical protein SK128_004391, partial [Halocaridina rubra]